MYYFKRIENSFVESPLWIFEGEEYTNEYSNSAILGNKELRALAPEWIETVYKNLDNIAEGVQEIEAGRWEYHSYADTLTELFNNYLPRRDGKKYSTQAIHKLHKAFSEYSGGWMTYTTTDDELTCLCACLSAMTGIEYDYFRLVGCCQGDINWLVAPANTDRETVEQAEAEYFNIGEEYRGLWVDPEDYCDEWTEEDTTEWAYIPYQCSDAATIERIAKYMGVPASAVTLI